MSAPGRLRHRVGEAIAAHQLWLPGQRVVVAVSGGMDSMVLIDVLHEIRDWHGGRLEVVTVDHGTRPDSTADADFVARWCRVRDIEVHVETLVLGDESEATSREARYAALASRGAAVIATAHHREDQSETVLLQLMRGVPPTGMRRVRGSVVRPLLEEPRAALSAWATERDLTWREDPTNQSPRYLRNRVRHELMPVLRALRPGIEGVLVRSAARLADDLALVDGMELPTVLTLAWVQQAPAPLVRRALGRRLGIEGSALEAVQRWLTAPRGTLDVGRGRRLSVEEGTLVVR